MIVDIPIIFESCVVQRGSSPSLLVLVQMSLWDMGYERNLALSSLPMEQSKITKFELSKTSNCEIV